VNTSSASLDAGADRSVKGHNGVSEMYAAGSGGSVDQVRLSLKLDTDPSTTTDFGWTTLHRASFLGHTKTVKALLEVDANPSPISDQGVRALRPSPILESSPPYHSDFSIFLPESPPKAISLYRRKLKRMRVFNCEGSYRSSVATSLTKDLFKSRLVSFFWLVM
jgi:hypothetical protein